MIDIPSGVLDINFLKNGKKTRVWLHEGNDEYFVSVEVDGNLTNDHFDSFKDAFDSFANIVKTLIKEEDWK